MRTTRVFSGELDTFLNRLAVATARLSMFTGESKTLKCEEVDANARSRVDNEQTRNGQ